MPERPACVLIVEDNQDIATMLDYAVRRYGASTTVVSTGTRAVQHLATTAYDVLMTDYTLPDMTGVHLIQQLPQTSLPPCIILMSGYSQASLEEQLTTITITTYLAKPFTIPALYQALDACQSPAIP